MELPTFFATIVLAASVAGNPALTVSRYETIYGADLRQRHLAQMNPARVFIGKSYGDILSCPFETPNNCQTFFADSYLRRIGDHVKFITVYGEYIFAALSETKKIVRCNLHKANSCEVFYVFDSVISSMNSGSGGHILVGLWNGNVFRCSLEPNSCTVRYTLGSWIASVIEMNNNIYIGTDSSIWRCLGTCYSSMRDEIPNLTELAVANNTIFALSSDNKLWKCPVGSNVNEAEVSFCEGTQLPGEGRRPRTMTSFNGNLYIADNDPSIPIRSCKWGTDVAECSDYLDHRGAKTVAFAYGTQKMDNLFKNEQKSCSWQGTKCPPYVTYYDATERSMFEVSVKRGKLYDSHENLLDTTDADVGTVGPAAIFVMAPEGRLFVSKTHARNLLHTSSLLAGQPVSGAGEMVVVDGVIKHINTCSQHYEPTVSLNSQVIESLLYQGYTTPIKSKKCYKDLEEDEFNESNDDNDNYLRP